jgi:hypothetical protein
MTNKTKIYLGLVAVVLTASGVTVAVANDQLCVDPEAQMLRELKWQGGVNTPEGREKLKNLSVFEKLEAEWCARRTMPKSEQDKEIEKGRQAALEHERERAQWEQAGLLETKAPVEPKPGIYTNEKLDPTILGNGYLIATNYWIGRVGGTSVMVVATALQANPTQGVVVVLENGDPTSAKTYTSPTATGPLKVVAEKSGSLTLQSVAGTYEVYNMDTDTRTNVTTAGGATHTFDLATKAFR